MHAPLARSGDREPGASRQSRSGASRDSEPGPLGRGADRGIDDCLDLPGLAQVRALVRAACDRSKEIRDLDRLQVVETELVARRHAEQAIRRMLRAGLDALEARLP